MRTPVSIKSKKNMKDQEKLHVSRKVDESSHLV